MDGWMDEWMGGWVGGCMDEWMNIYIISTHTCILCTSMISRFFSKWYLVIHYLTIIPGAHKIRSM